MTPEEYVNSEQFEKIEKAKARLMKVVDALISEYGDIIENVKPEEYGKMADLTIEQMENMTVLDVMVRIRERHGIIQSNDDSVEIAKTRRIENYFITNDKLSKFFSWGIGEHGDKDVPVSMGKNKSKEYHALVSMEFLNLPNVTSTTSFNHFEWQIHNALVSLSFHNEWVTDYMIYEVVAKTYFNKSDANPSEESLEEIRTIVRKIISCYIKIDISNDTPMKKEQVIKEGFLISADIEKRILNGQIREGYRINRNSIAYAYASAKNQVITVPLKLLHTKVRFSKETSILKEYLVQRIAVMKNGRNKVKSRDILFESIYKVIPFKEGMDKTVVSRKKRRIKGHVLKMLDELTRDNFIKGYDATDKRKIIIKL